MAKTGVDHRSEGPFPRRRLLTIVGTYGLAALVSGLVIRAGAAVSRTDADFGLPWTIVGSGGALGALAIVGAALYARRGVEGRHVDPVRLARAVLVARVARALMLAAAIAGAVAGVLLAPAGLDRAFAITVSLVLAALLAVFALLANDISRAVARLAPTEAPPSGS
ncbi:hypothetical protein [Plantactinospora sp. CA-290183]|uniref:hypothetical protein n=1 Tax=Plantactinospora sp. CA-290183 TaxID=3240006 RepID=UPI003D8E5D3F